MSTFDYLLVAHLVADYLLQSNWMAMNKTKKLFPLLTHAFVYTAVIAIALAISAQPLKLWVIAFVFISHAVIDRRTLTTWWVTHVMGAEGVPWLTIVADQVVHIVILAVIAVLIG